jgi:hypothetical protein
LARQWEASFLEVSGRHHFDVTADLIDGGPLADLALGLARIAAAPAKVTASSA